MGPFTQYTLPPFPLPHRVRSGVPCRWGETGAVWKELGGTGEPLRCLDQCGWPQQGKALSRQPETPWASIIVKGQFWGNVTVALEKSVDSTDPDRGLSVQQKVLACLIIYCGKILALIPWVYVSQTWKINADSECPRCPSCGLWLQIWLMLRQANNTRDSSIKEIKELHF